CRVRPFSVRPSEPLLSLTRFDTASLLEPELAHGEASVDGEAIDTPGRYYELDRQILSRCSYDCIVLLPRDAIDMDTFFRLAFVGRGLARFPCLVSRGAPPATSLVGERLVSHTEFRERHVAGADNVDGFAGERDGQTFPRCSCSRPRYRRLDRLRDV